MIPAPPARGKRGRAEYYTCYLLPVVLASVTVTRLSFVDVRSLPSSDFVVSVAALMPAPLAVLIAIVARHVLSRTHVGARRTPGS